MTGDTRDLVHDMKRDSLKDRERTETSYQHDCYFRTGATLQVIWRCTRTRAPGKGEAARGRKNRKEDAVNSSKVDSFLSRIVVDVQDIVAFGVWERGKKEGVVHKNRG